jgi:uncharacterized coiled-coil protein SlyX
MNNSIIEISKKTAKAGRTNVSLILHKIPRNDNDYNGNGILWKKEYVEQNIDSVQGMPIVAQFLDQENTIPTGSHGNMIVEENKIIFEDSLVVGSFDSAKIVENIEVNGEKIDALVGIGVLYDQRFPELVSYLQEQYDNGKSVEGSVEVCADKSKGNTKIIYDGGWKPKARIPKIYQYSGHALVIDEIPADASALLLELNTKKKEVDNFPDKNIKIEINELNHEDISILVENLFNKKFNENSNDYKYFYICKFYPTISTFIMKSWSAVGEYYKSTYTINDAKLVISDIVKVEESWKPVNGENSIEVNSSLFNIINNQNNQTKEVNKEMDEKIVLELNKKIEDKTNEINALNKDIETKATEINSLTTKVTELETKVSEFSATIVEINKSLETEKTEKEKVTVEFNSLKEEKEKKDAEVLKVEINTYFDVEIPKNGFEESEVNSLKEYVEKCDFDGLKNAEKELVFKKFKESKVSVETNTSNTTNFIATKKVDESKKTSIPTFFNN